MTDSKHFQSDILSDGSRKTISKLDHCNIATYQ